MVFLTRCRQAQHMLKHKVVFVMGATGTGKSRLAIDLAVHFGAAEIVNSDKMQVYDGLNIVTNKVTSEECAGVPHHLLGGVHPDSDFTASDFRREAMVVIESVISRGKIPIVAGGSNSYIEELVDGNGSEFRSKYECCFIWVDVELPVLYSFVSYRVDRMVEMGLVEEVRGFFDPDGDYSKGIRRAIGVPEMDRYIRSEVMIESVVEEIKVNTCRLACCQLAKIHRLCGLSGWDVCRVDATEVFAAKRGEDTDKAWGDRVVGPSVDIVQDFLGSKTATCGMTVPSSSREVAAKAGATMV